MISGIISLGTPKKDKTGDNTLINRSISPLSSNKLTIMSIAQIYGNISKISLNAFFAPRVKVS